MVFIFTAWTGTYTHTVMRHMVHIMTEKGNQDSYLVWDQRTHIYLRGLLSKKCSTSSTDAEILAARSCTQMLAWIQDLMHELDIESLSPAILYQDNQSAIIVYNSDTHSYKRVKHLLTSIGFIQSMIERGLLKILHLPSADMTADMATKSLCYHQHVKHTFSCCVHDLSELE